MATFYANYKFMLFFSSRWHIYLQFTYETNCLRETCNIKKDDLIHIGITRTNIYNFIRYDVQ